MCRDVPARHRAMSLLAIHLPPLTDRHHQHHKTVILDGGNDPVITYAVAPQSLAVAGQRMAEASRVLAAGDALAQISQHASFPVRAELAQVADGCAMKFDSPDRRGHRRFVWVSSCRSRLSSVTRGPPRARRRRAR